MIPVDGPGISLIAQHERFEAPLPVLPSKDAGAVGESGAADGAMFEDMLKNVVGTANDSINNAQAALAE